MHHSFVRLGREEVTGVSRHTKQFLLIIGLSCGAYVAYQGLRIAAGEVDLAETWPFLTACAAVTVAAAYCIFGLASVPSADDIAAAAEHIAAFRARSVEQGRESHKANLRFYVPPDWRRHRAGRDGWILYPKGLGTPIHIALWAFDEDPAYQDGTVEGLARNARDLCSRQGLELLEPSIGKCRIAGQDGIRFVMRRGRRERAEGYLWKYEGGDYMLVFEGTSIEHLDLVRAALDEFHIGLFMW